MSAALPVPEERLREVSFSPDAWLVGVELGLDPGPSVLLGRKSPSWEESIDL